MLLPEESCQSPEMREDGTDQPWNEIQASEEGMDATVHDNDNDQQVRINWEPAGTPPPMPVESLMGASTRMPYSQVKGKMTGTWFPDEQKVMRYKSKYPIFLCSVEQLQNRMGAIDTEKAQIKPKQLSTMKTASEINNLTTAGLIDSIKAICLASKPFTRENRMMFHGFHNWVLVDLCRRMQILQQRFERRYKGRAEDEIRTQVIDVIAGAEEVKPQIIATSAFAKTLDGEFFDLFPPFVSRKRSQILSVANTIGDEICALTEFIDMKDIGEMDPDEHFDFLHDLRLSKDRIKSLFEAIKESNPFHGDPTSSYDKVTLLNGQTL